MSEEDSFGIFSATASGEEVFDFHRGHMASIPEDAQQAQLFDTFLQKNALFKTVHFQYIEVLKNEDFGSNKGYPLSDLFSDIFFRPGKAFCSYTCGVLTGVRASSCGNQPSSLVTNIL